MKSESLHFKINIAILLTGIFISVLFAAILYPLESSRNNSQIQRIEQLLDTVFKQKRDDLANELFARQERALEASLEEMQRISGIVGVSICLPDGQPFLASGKLRLPRLAAQEIRLLGQSPVFNKRIVSGRSVGRYASIIEVIGQKIGYIAIYYDLARIEKEARQSVGLFIMLLVATLVLMALLLNLFLFHSVIQPVSLLRDAMQCVAEGRLGETVRASERDEIGQMGRTFNAMSLELKKGREALVKTQEKYRSIFENAIEGIFQCSPRSGRFITVNPSMAQMLGYRSPEELLTSIGDIGRQLFVQRLYALEFDSRLQCSGRVIGFETELHRKDRSSIWVSISARRVTDLDGRTAYDEGSLVDITERRQRERAEREREAAEVANKAKSKFLAHMSHEIRTPLNAILGFADILASTLQDPTQKSHIQTIKSSGTALLQLINDILDLSKIEAGRLQIEPVPVDLASLLSELHGIFSINASRKGVSLLLEVLPHEPPNVMIDKVRLRQVLFNLIGNAVKFTDQGEVTCSARIEPTGAQEHCRLTVEVSDTGIGIDPQDHQEIFKSFWQHRTSSDTMMQGTGLGLTISKNLVEMMGGHISLQSGLGQGSTFSLRFEDVAMVSAPQAPGKPIGDGTTPSGGIIFESATVLVADDLEINRQLIVAALAESPLTILQAEDGGSAIAKALACRPDIILMDIKMPDMDGYAAIKQIRSDHRLKEIPVLAITAAGMREDVDRIKPAGFDDYLIRPFSKHELEGRLAHFLKNHPVSEESGSGVVRMAEFMDQGSVPADRRWRCPSQVAEMLRGELRQRCDEVRRKQRMPDIKRFAEQLVSLGERHQLETLVCFGENLTRCANLFDINQVQKTLNQYEALIDGIDEAQDQALSGEN